MPNNDAMWMAALWASIHSDGPGPLEVQMDNQTLELGTKFAASLAGGNANLAPKEVTQALEQAGVSSVTGEKPNCPAGDNLVSIVSDGNVVAQFCVNGKFFSK